MGAKEKKLSPPRCFVYSSSAEDGRWTPNTQPSEIVEGLLEAITSRARWEETVRRIIDDGLTEKVYEVGPMSQLKAMMKRTDPTLFKAMMNIEV